MGRRPVDQCANEVCAVPAACGVCLNQRAAVARCPHVGIAGAQVGAHLGQEGMRCAEHTLTSAAMA